MSVENQSPLAIAVAHRALTGTFLVIEEGAETCAESSDRVEWPDAYRAGLIAALLINSEGQIETTPWAVRQIGLLLAMVGRPVKILTDLLAICRHAWLSPQLAQTLLARRCWKR